MKSLSPNAWNRENAAHLLSRAGFGANPETMDRFTGLGLNKAVEALIDFPVGQDDYAPPRWTQIKGANLRLNYQEMRKLSEEERRAKRQAWNRQQRFRIAATRAWWLHRMRVDAFPLREKMTLFLHGHFATSENKVKHAFAHYKQNQMFREHAGGNWKTLVREISRDPAMLLYLDNQQSRKKNPNENFARELLELFTLGEGHYSETDILNAARAFTGWSLNPKTIEYKFKPFMHDTGEKTFLGKTGTLDGDDIVDLIIENPAAADHLAMKLIRFFVSDRPAPELQNALASVIKTEGFEMKPILRTLFLSEDFYSPDFMNNQIKSPVQWFIGILTQLDTAMPPPHRGITMVNNLGQKLFAPPNVKGWDGGFAWITASNLLNRYNYAGQLVQLNATQKDLKILAKLLGLNQKGMPEMMQPMMMEESMMSDSMNMATDEGMMNSEGMDSTPVWPYGSKAGLLVEVDKLVPSESRNQPKKMQEILTSRLFPGGLSSDAQDKITTFLDTLPSSDPWTDQDIRTFIHLMMSTPHYQLA